MAAQAERVRDRYRRRGSGRARDRLSPGRSKGARSSSWMRASGSAIRGAGAGTRCGCTRPPSYGRAPGHAVPGSARLISDEGRRWPTTSRPTRRSSSFPVRSGRQVDALSKEGRPLRRDHGRADLRGGQRRRCHGRHARGRIVPSFAPELDPRITAAPLQRLPEPRPSYRRAPVLVVGASHSGLDIAYEAAASTSRSCRAPDTGQIPVPARDAARPGRLPRTGLRRHPPAQRWTRRWAARCDRTSGTAAAPLLRYRKKDLAAAGVERVFARAVSVQGGLPVLADGRVLDVAERDLVHRL